MTIINAEEIGEVGHTCSVCCEMMEYGQAVILSDTMESVIHADCYEHEGV